MSPPANLADPRFFPSLASLPSGATDTASGFYTAVGPHFIPTRHWCLFAEIIQNHEDLELQAVDRAGREIAIVYSSEVNEALGKFFRVGHTIAILYPLRTAFRDGSVGLRIGEEGRVMVIPRSGMELRALNGRVKQQNEAVEGMFACHGCGVRKEKSELLACARCGLAWYCGKYCQTNAWKERTHKGDCKVLMEIKGLFTWRWEEYHQDTKFPLE